MLKYRRLAVFFCPQFIHDTRQLMIKNGFFALGVLLLTGCTSVTDEVRATVEYAFKGAEDAELSADEIENFPYTSLYAQWQGQARNLIVLGYVNQPNEHHFVTAEKETLVLSHGRLIRTQNLSANVLSVSNLSKDPLLCLVTQPENCDNTWKRTYDYEYASGKRVSRTVKSSFFVKERKTLEMPYGKTTAVLVEETGEFVLTGDTFTNRFWVEPDGHVIKSQQRIFPNEPVLALTQVTWIGRTNNAGSRK